MKRIGLMILFSTVFGISFACAQILMTGAGNSSIVSANYSGLITFVNTGTCPAGTTEVSSFDGKTIFGTLNAHGDVAGTGGSDSITATTASVTQPTISAITLSGSTAAEASHTHSVTSNVTGTYTSAGTLAWPAGVPTSTASTVSWPAGVPTSNALTFTGTAFSSVINHTHTVTMTWNVQGGTTAATTGTHVMTSTAVGGSARAPTTGDVVSAVDANPAGGVSSITPAGTINTPTLSWPAGVPTNSTPTISWPAGVPTYTGTGSQAVTQVNNAVTSGAGSSHLHAVGTLAASTPTASGTAITMNSFDNRSAYVKWIACKID